MDLDCKKCVKAKEIDPCSNSLIVFLHAHYLACLKCKGFVQCENQGYFCMCVAGFWLSKHLARVLCTRL